MRFVIRDPKKGRVGSLPAAGADTTDLCFVAEGFKMPEGGNRTW